jgi:hypothetical protein
MKKSFLLIALALFSLIVLGQEQEKLPLQPSEQPQVQAAEPQPAPLPPQGRDLKIVRFPEAFIHAGKDYAAGNYRMVLAEKDGQSVFFVENAQKEPLFEELAVVKARRGGGAGSGFRVSRELMLDKEYFRVKVTTPGQWLMGYFLVKK